MAVKKRKYTVKTKSRMVVIFLFFLVVISTLGYTLFLSVSNIINLKMDQAKLEDKNTALEEEEKIIQADIERLQDPVYIARYAREKYFYSKDEEIILRMMD